MDSSRNAISIPVFYLKMAYTVEQIPPPVVSTIVPLKILKIEGIHESDLGFVPSAPLVCNGLMGDSASLSCATALRQLYS